jgi:hypothetical protein
MTTPTQLTLLRPDPPRRPPTPAEVRAFERALGKWLADVAMSQRAKPSK